MSADPNTTSKPVAADDTVAHDASGRQSAAPSSSATQLARAKISVREALRHFPDFPIPGIDFVDIMPLFARPDVHAQLLDALELQIRESFVNSPTGNGKGPDVVVGLDARGFLFGPGLAMRLGVGFAAVRKKGKLPGPCATAEYVKEYGKDFFQMQEDAVSEGQNVLIVDDIIATGGSAKAAADLVTQLKGNVMGFVFILEVPGLSGREKLAPHPSTILIEDI
jgi:adenine phosphoribosyltransferase